MKLPNGYGSIYKKSGNRRKPYVVIVTDGWNDEGKQKRKILGYVTNPSNGLKLLAEYHGNPYNLNFKNLKFKDIWKDVEKELKELVEYKKMSESNLKCLSLAYKNYCMNLYNDKILDIKYKKMQDIIDNTNLGYTGKGYIKTVCKKVFDKAITLYELPIGSNPAEKLNCGIKIKSEKHIPFTDEEIDILWKNQNNDVIKILLLFCYTGTRPNEIFITKKENIFLEKDYFITGSKTEAGKNRIIPIHPKIKPIIEYFIQNECNEPFKCIIDNFNYNKFSRLITKTMKEFNLYNKSGELHTSYDARHTFITKMKKVGVDPYLIKIIIGHSIKDITESVYTHRDINELLNAIKMIN